MKNIIILLIVVLGFFSCTTQLQYKYTPVISFQDFYRVHSDNYTSKYFSTTIEIDGEVNLTPYILSALTENQYSALLQAENRKYYNNILGDVYLRLHQSIKNQVGSGYITTVFNNIYTTNKIENRKIEGSFGRMKERKVNINYMVASGYAIFEKIKTYE